VIAADVGVAVVAGTLLLEPVRLADRRVEIDRQRLAARTRPCRPAPGEQLATDPIELADVAPAEAAQERAEGRRRLDREAEDPIGGAGPQGVRVVDAVAAGEHRHDEGQELVAGVRRAGLGAEPDVLVDQLLEPEVLGQRGRQQEPSVGHQPVVVEGHLEPVEAVR